MTFKKKWVFIAGILIILISLFFLIGKRQFIPKVKLTSGDISVHLMDGDIICRLGDRLWSHVFKDISPVDKRFSHLGIVRIVDDKITVIHAEGRAIEGMDSVNETDLDEFLDIALAVGIYRLNDFDGGMISSEALNFIGYPFDWNFNLDDENRIYCTELLHRILKIIAPEIRLITVFQKEINKEIIPLEAVSNSEYFSEIFFASVY